MSSPFPPQIPSSSRGLSLLLGFALALFILLLVPLSQIMEPERVAVSPIEAVELASPPPPPPLEEPSPPKTPEADPPPPELKRSPPMPTLEQLEVALNPGTGGDMRLDIGLGIDFSTEAPDELEELFGFGELDEVPHLVRQGRFRLPPNLPRKLLRENGFVRLLVYVEADGRISVQQVLDYSHREFVDSAREMAEASRFSTPMRNGQPVRSRYEWTIQIK